MATYQQPSNDLVAYGSRVTQASLSTGTGSVVVSDVTSLNTNGGYLTFGPGTSKQETVHYSGYTALTRTVTLDVRGITFEDGVYTTGVGYEHDLDTIVIISDNATDLYSVVNDDVTFAGDDTFSGDITFSGDAEFTTISDLGTVTTATSITTSLFKMGTTSTEAPFVINSSINSGDSGSPTMIMEGDDNKVVFYIKGAGVSSIPVFRGGSCRGTIASPTAVESGDNLVYFSAGGHDGTDWTGSKAALVFSAEDDWGTGDTPTVARIELCPDGSATRQTVLELDSSGNLDIDGAYSRAGTPITQKVAWGWGTGANASTQNITIPGFTAIHRIEFHASNATTDIISFGSTDTSNNRCIVGGTGSTGGWESYLVKATATAVYTSWSAPTLTITWTNDGTDVDYIWYAFGY